MTVGPRIRQVVASDLPALATLNNDAVPAVNRLSVPDLARFADMAPYFSVAEADAAPVGLLIALGPGADYQSVNYRWFGARYPAFLYVDRVVVDPGSRSAGIGASLYADLETAALAAGVPLLACEVNIRPSNDRSRRFHERLGFRGVGIQDTEGGAKTVQLMLRDLTV